jgi:hypothetical protein
LTMCNAEVLQSLCEFRAAYVCILNPEPSSL